jgi:hypothetical protein
MKAYEANATIAATPEAIWEILIDGKSYTAWDSGVVRLEGTIALGERSFAKFARGLKDRAERTN